MNNLRRVMGVVTAGLVLLHGATAFGHGTIKDRIPRGLQGVPIPKVPGLLDGPSPIVVDKQMAIALGKALFWDINIGSDGLACASCHFHAGADSRVTNQLAPGLKHATVTGSTFEHPAGGVFGPNSKIKASDFPFTAFQIADDNTSPLIRDTDDVMSSSGTFSGRFTRVHGAGKASDECEPLSNETIYRVGSVQTRRVEPRNTPTVINAVFNHRNFWDGRANNVFNGRTPFGERDPEAWIWVYHDGDLWKTRLTLENASLASQAVAPPLSDLEMSCGGRSFMEIGRKVIGRRALEAQMVHPGDSVLGGLRHPTARGLVLTYREMIQKAFASQYWVAPGGRPEFGTPKSGALSYEQIEANFSLFFGVAVMMYEATLVSDQAPFDTSPRDENGIPVQFTADQIEGLQQFINGHCLDCHAGPLFTSAVYGSVFNFHGDADHDESEYTMLQRLGVLGAGTSASRTALTDRGYFYNGAVKDDYDPGINGVDDYGYSLSLAAQFRELLQGKLDAVGDRLRVKPCDFSSPFNTGFTANELTVATITDACPDETGRVPIPSVAAAEAAKGNTGRLALATHGVFKTPTLRNVELTGPFMHNGGFATLEQAIEQYVRGGNFSGQALRMLSIFPQSNFLKRDGNPFDPDPVKNAREAVRVMVEFLKTLTDERVRWERAPFDHPELLVPHGHAGSASAVVAGTDGKRAVDEFLYLPCVGAAGRGDDALRCPTPEGALVYWGPVMPFHELLEP